MGKIAKIFNLFLIFGLLFTLACGGGSDSVDLFADVITTVSGNLYDGGITETISKSPVKTINKVSAIPSSKIGTVEIEIAGIKKDVKVDSDGFFKVDITNQDVLSNSSSLMNIIGKTPDVSELSTVDILNDYTLKIKINIVGESVPVTALLPASIIKNKKATLLPKLILKKENGRFKYKVQNSNGKDILSDSGDFLEELNTARNRNELLSGLMTCSADDFISDLAEKTQLRQRIQDSGKAISDNSIVSGNSYICSEDDNTKYLYKFAQSTFEIDVFKKDSSWTMNILKGTYEISADSSISFGFVSMDDKSENALTQEEIVIKNEILSVQNIYSTSLGLKFVNSSNNKEKYLLKTNTIEDSDLMAGGFFAPGNFLQQGYGFLYYLEDTAEVDGKTDTFKGMATGTMLDMPSDRSYVDIDYKLQIQRMYIIGSTQSDKIKMFNILYDIVSGERVFDSIIFDDVFLVNTKLLTKEDLSGNSYFVKVLKKPELNSVFEFTDSNIIFYNSDIDRSQNGTTPYSLKNNCLSVNGSNFICIDNKDDIIKFTTQYYISSYVRSEVIFKKLLSWDVNAELTNKKYIIKDNLDNNIMFLDLTENEEMISNGFTWYLIDGTTLSGSNKLEKSTKEIVITVNDSEEKLVLSKFEDLGTGNFKCVFKRLDQNGDLISHGENIGIYTMQKVDEFPYLNQDSPLSNSDIKNLINGNKFIADATGDFSSGLTTDWYRDRGIIEFKEDGTYELLTHKTYLSYSDVSELSTISNYGPVLFTDYQIKTGTWEVKTEIYEGETHPTHPTHEIIYLSGDLQDTFEIEVSGTSNFDSYIIKTNTVNFNRLSKINDVNISDLYEEDIQFCKIDLPETDKTLNNALKLQISTKSFTAGYNPDPTLVDIINRISVYEEGKSVIIKIYPETSAGLEKHYQIYQSFDGRYVVKFYENSELKAFQYLISLNKAE